MTEWSDTLKKGLASTTPPTKALIGLGMLLLLTVACGDSQEASKPTQQSSNKTASFPSGQEKQLPRTSGQLVQVSTACPEWGTPALFKVDVLQRCIADGLNPNAKIEKETLLTAVAIMPGQDAAEAVQVLLEAGANVNTQNKEGVSALMLASAAGHTATVQALLDAGADVKAQNKEGLPAFAIASLAGHTAIVQALLDAGDNIDAQGEDRLAAFMLASTAGHTATVQALLDAGADVNTLFGDGKMTALMFASLAGHTATVQALLDAGANPNLQMSRNDQISRWVRGSVKDGYQLSSMWGFLSAWDGNGSTALMLASLVGHTATVQALLDAEADPELRDIQGGTASGFAELGGHMEIVKMIERAAAFR